MLREYNKSKPMKYEHSESQHVQTSQGLRPAFICRTSGGKTAGRAASSSIGLPSARSTASR